MSKTTKSKPTWTVVDNRTAAEIYRGSKEADAARVARTAAEENAQLQPLAPDRAVVFKDGIPQYYYETDPTMGRMKARKVFASLGVVLTRVR